MPAQENFRVNLASVMEKNGISQYEMNRVTGISRAYINKVLMGTTQPSLGYCERLAAGVKIPLLMLLLDPKKFDEITRESLNRIAPPDAEFLTRQLTPDSPTPPNLQRSRHNKQKKASKNAEDISLMIWIRRLLQKSAG